MGDLGRPRSTRGPTPGTPSSCCATCSCRRRPASEADRVTLVPLAPMTNIALLLRTWPEAAAGLRRIVFMGGAADVGNATASAEFNVWHDPEAAAIVLETAAELGVPVTMYGLDVFYDVRVSREQAQELVRRGGAAELAGLLVLHQCERFGTPDATVGRRRRGLRRHRAPDALTTVPLPVRVELTGTWSRGRTVVDRRDWSGDLAHDPHGLAAATVDVALGVDGRRCSALWLDTVGGA